MAVQNYILTVDEAVEIMAEKGKIEGFEPDKNTKNEGGYIRPELQGFESPDAVHNLKQALDRERQNARDGNANGKEAERLQAELDALKAKAGDPNAAPELQEQVTTMQTQLADMTATLAKERSQRTIAESVAASRGNLGLTEFLQRRVAVDKDTGKAGAIDPDTGEALLAADGTPLSVAQYVAALRESATNGDDSIAALFIGTQSSGAGTPPGGGHGGGGSVSANTSRSKMTARQKVDFLRQHGDAAFQALKF